MFPFNVDNASYRFINNNNKTNLKTDSVNMFTKINNISISNKRKLFDLSLELKKSIKKDINNTIHT